MNRRLQPQRGDRPRRHVEGVEDTEGALLAFCVERLTDDGPAAAARFGEEERLAAEVVEGRRLVDVARARAAPARVDELVEELAPAPARGGDAEHPEVLAGQRRPARVNRGEVGREPVR